jgi:hypothetical protein
MPTKPEANFNEVVSAVADWNSFPVIWQGANGQMLLDALLMLGVDPRDDHQNVAFAAGGAVYKSGPFIVHAAAESEVMDGRTEIACVPNAAHRVTGVRVEALQITPNNLDASASFAGGTRRAIPAPRLPQSRHNPQPPPPDIQVIDVQPWLGDQIAANVGDWIVKNSMGGIFVVMAAEFPSHFDITP